MLLSFHSWDQAVILGCSIITCGSPTLLAQPYRYLERYTAEGFPHPKIFSKLACPRPETSVTKGISVLIKCVTYAQENEPDVTVNAEGGQI